LTDNLEEVFVMGLEVLYLHDKIEKILSAFLPQGA
jgi:hypothetical protein